MDPCLDLRRGRGRRGRGRRRLPARSQPLVAAQRVDRQRRHARRALRGASRRVRLVRRAAGRRRRWSSPTRSPRRCATRRTRATASTSARAWRPNARCPGGRCRAACCHRSRSSGATSSGATPPIAPRRWLPGASPTRRDAASRARRSASGSRARSIAEEVLRQGRQLPPAAAHRPVDVLRPRQPADARDRDRRPAHREGRDDRPQFPSGARERDPRARRRQQGRADRRRHRPCGPQRRGSGGVGRGAERRRRDVRARRPRQPALLPAGIEVRLAARDAEVDRRCPGQGNRLQARAHRRHRGPAWSTPTGKGRPTPPSSRCCRPRSARPPHRSSGASTATASSRRTASRSAPTTCGRATARCWSTRPRRSRSPIRIWTPRPSCASPTRARASAGGSSARTGRAVEPEARAVLVGALAAGAAAQGGRGDRPRRQVRGRNAAAGALRDLDPRRARASCQITSGPREVEIPIDPGATVDLPDTITVRPQAEE